MIFWAESALVAGAIIAAGCGVAGDVAEVGSGPLPGGSVTIKLAGVAAVRTGAGSFIALGMACTHEGTKVNIQGQIFDCPNHGARFSSNGNVTNGPATRALAQRTVVFDPTAQTLSIS